MKTIKKTWDEITNAFWKTLVKLLDAVERINWDVVGGSLIISVLIFFAADVIAGKTVRTNGVVVDKVYTPERDYMSLETRTDGNGKVYQELVHHHDPPQWKFIVQDNSADIVNVWCSRSNYNRTPIGTQIPILIRYGKWTHWVFLRYTLEYH